MCSGCAQVCLMCGEIKKSEKCSSRFQLTRKNDRFFWRFAQMCVRMCVHETSFFLCANVYACVCMCVHVCVRMCVAVVARARAHTYTQKT